MDFLKILKSFEELIYEIMVILVFFPRTLYLTLRYPQRMMDYADTELGDVISEQYDDTLSPPLFLVICIAISQGIGLMSGDSQSDTLPELLQSPQNILLLNVFAFSLIPLLMSLRLLGQLKIPLNRTSLRPPFYSQCFVTAPTALAVGLSTSIARLIGSESAAPGWILFGLISGWFVWQQVNWFKAKIGLSMPRAITLALSSTLLSMCAVILAVLVAYLLSRGLS